MAKLENKTKAQLIEIILRKDEVEAQLRAENESLKNDYQSACDEYTTQSQTAADNYEEILRENEELKNSSQSLKSAYDSLQGDLASYKKQFNSAIKDCRGTAAALDAEKERNEKLLEELAECKRQRDAWLATTIVSVIIACVVICLL